MAHSGSAATGTALMLPGGGARAAYQVGVLKAIRETVDDGGGPIALPFPILVGTSAGAINAAALATQAQDFGAAVRRMEALWRSLRCDHVYRTDWLCVLRQGLHWAGALLFGLLGVPAPRWLLDTTPLRDLLEREIPFRDIDASLHGGALAALAITASSYDSASAITFFQARGRAPWARPRRAGREERICVEHVMASAALPLIFPATRIHGQNFGDGGMRQTAPLSPAIHLGAERILVVSTRDERPDPEPADGAPSLSFGDIAGHLLDVLFLDNLQADLARLARINRTLALMDPALRERTGLRRIDTLVVRPSCDLRPIVDRHLHRVPPSVRLLLAGIGAWRAGTRLPGYLLFDGSLCGELIDLGHDDGMRSAAQIQAFLRGRDASAMSAGDEG